MKRTKKKERYLVMLLKFLKCRFLHFYHWNYSQWANTYVCVCPICEKIWKIRKRDFEVHTKKSRNLDL